MVLTYKHTCVYTGMCEYMYTYIHNFAIMWHGFLKSLGYAKSHNKNHRAHGKNGVGGTTLKKFYQWQLKKIE